MKKLRNRRSFIKKSFLTGMSLEFIPLAQLFNNKEVNNTLSQNLRMAMTENEIKRIEIGLKLGKSSSIASQVWGWKAVSNGLKNLAKITGKSFPKKVVDKVTNSSVAVNNDFSINTLLTLYSLDATARHNAMFSLFNLSLEGDALALSQLKNKISLMAEVDRPIPTSPTISTNLKPLTNINEFDPLKFGSQLVKYRSQAASENIQSEIFERLLNGNGSDYAILRAIFTVMPDVRKSVWPDGAVNTIRLARALANDSINSTDVSVIQTAKRASLVILHEQNTQLSFSTILKNSAINPTPTSSLTNGSIGVIPLNSSISAGGITVYTDEGHAVPIENIVGANRSSLVGLTPEWKMFTSSSYRCGSTYLPISLSIPKSDSPGTLVSCLGVQHKTWRLAGGSGSPVFKINVAYKSDLSTVWTAVRWKGASSNSVSVVPKAGTLSVIPIAIEPVTGWQIYSVIPGSTMEFEAVLTSAIQDQDPNSVLKGISIAPLFQEYIEILELNTGNISAFANNDINDLMISSSSNPLLTYLANLQRSLTNDGVLVNGGSKLTDLSALTSISAFAILGIISQTNLGDVNAITNTAAPIERQASLKSSLPMLAAKIYNAYISSLEKEILILSASVSKLDNVRNQLDLALKTLNQLTVDQIKKLLDDTSTSAQLPTDSTLSSLEELRVALSGAYELLAQLITDQGESQERRCIILKIMQEKRFNPYILMESDPSVLGICTN